ncbi:MAG: hypothetical protein HY721_23560 [Planctomycetes bacterium]|nr:hypothetical protein [Planctomycetota bacterium]
MHPADIVIVFLYLASVTAIGARARRKASQGIESYFLGGRSLPWWMIAMSGSNSYFDITGTMWIVSLFVVLGFKGWWIQCMWGFVIPVFFMVTLGKWIQRSRVMTGSEWMVVRFGGGRSGEAARLAYTVYAVLTLTAFIAYTTVGMGKFGSAYFTLTDDPALNDKLCALLVIGSAGAYVVLGGFHALVIVETIQTTVLTLGAIAIAVIGFLSFDAGKIAASVPADWWSIAPTWTVERASPGFEYEAFGALVAVFVVKGLLLCLSGPEQLFDFQKFLACRNAREASLMGWLWGVLHTVRWPMAMGIAVISLSGSFESLGAGDNDPEKVLPAVIAHGLPVGFRGLAVAALLAAFMGAFGSMVNGAASYLVRDIYQRYLRPDASERRLVAASCVASVLMLAAGVWISTFASSINGVFVWIMVGLGAGVLVPNVLRWYWWRFNGWGFAAGCAAGMALSLLQAVLALERFGLRLPVYASFPILAGSVAVVAVAVSLLTPPDPPEALAAFYRGVRPWGLWGPVRRGLGPEALAPLDPSSPRREALAIAVGIPWLASLYMFPAYWVAHRWGEMAVALAVCLVTSAGLVPLWLRGLPARERGGR